MAERDQVFITYSHKDRDVVDQLRTQLRPLERDCNVHVWDDSAIQPGDLWQQEIEAALLRARVAVALVSADFLASKLCMELELPTLLAAHEQFGVLVLLLIVRPSVFRLTDLSRFQAVNQPDRPLSTLPRPKRELIIAGLAERIGYTFGGAESLSA